MLYSEPVLVNTVPGSWQLLSTSWGYEYQTYVPPAVLATPAPVRHGQTLSFDEFRREVAEAVEADPRSQTALADALGVSRSAVSRALSDRATTRDAGVLRRLAPLVTPYDVEDVTAPAYRAVRRGG